MKNIEPRDIDVKDLQGYLRWALEHVLNARLVAEDLKQPIGVQAAIQEAEKLLSRASTEVTEREENFEYTRGEVPEDQRCGSTYKWGRVCKLRAGHKSKRHRDCEISWTSAMAEEWRRISEGDTQ